MNRPLVLASLSLACCSALANPPWPAAEKQAAIAGCRLSITTHAEQDYLKRHNLKELPPGFREKIAGPMEPYLAVCDCAFDQIEKQWSFDHFMSHQAELPPLIKQLMTGPCAAPAAPPRSPASGGSTS